MKKTSLRKVNLKAIIYLGLKDTKEKRIKRKKKVVVMLF